MATKRVLVELRVPRARASKTALPAISSELKSTGLILDEQYEPVPMVPREDLKSELAANDETIVVVRGTIEEGHEEALRREPRVIGVWTDSRITMFGTEGAMQSPSCDAKREARTSPCYPYDCDSETAKGDLAAVASHIGADSIWAQGHRGQGVVIGIVDSGVTIPGVIGGWPHDWGTVTTGHGNMTATDALGIAPDAKIYDIRLTPSELLSDALSGFRWAIAQYRQDGTPQVLSNSWGMPQEALGPDYANNPNHPFTRKVVEAIDAGILVCFAAGNCGEVCPDERCNSDTGPGRSIWGANGHPKVLTVGAANILGEWIGYSSQGPAALDQRKPDICAPSHFKGYTDSDTGTSAACPIVAGVLALMRNAESSIRQREAKLAIQLTARNLCSPGWDQHSGYGMIQAAAALDEIMAVSMLLVEHPT